MMRLFETIAGWLEPPPLTRGRILFAFTVAGVVDAIQIALGPLGFIFIDDILDVVALALTIRVLGFHPLLLPTFLIEVVPVAEVFPTWTGCVAAVVLLRKRVRDNSAPPPIVTADTPKTPPPPPYIDV